MLAAPFNSTLIQYKLVLSSMETVIVSYLLSIGGTTKLYFPKFNFCDYIDALLMMMMHPFGRLLN